MTLREIMRNVIVTYELSLVLGSPTLLDKSLIPALEAKCSWN